MDEKELTPRETVYQCIVDMHSSGRIPTREMVVQETGMKFSVVDDQVKRLREEGRIVKVVNGVYEPVQVWAERAVSSTILDDGRAVLEIGDMKDILTPREARKVIQVLGGIALMFGR